MHKTSSSIIVFIYSLWCSQITALNISIALGTLAKYIQRLLVIETDNVKQHQQIGKLLRQ